MVYITHERIITKPVSFFNINQSIYYRPINQKKHVYRTRLYWNVVIIKGSKCFMVNIFLKVVFDNNKGNSFSDMWQKLTIVWSS